MPTELEAKIKVADLAPLRARLRSAGARPIGQYHETNRFFDTAPPTLAPADRGLRLRTSRDTQSGRTTHTLTYKGPRQPGPFKQREEIELTLDDPAAAQSLLEALGFTRGLTFEKRRQSWHLGPCRIELDDVPPLGQFVEVEGPAQDAITAILQALNLENEPPIRQSYPQLLTEK